MATKNTAIELRALVVALASAKTKWKTIDQTTHTFTGDERCRITLEDNTRFEVSLTYSDGVWTYTKLDLRPDFVYYNVPSATEARRFESRNNFNEIAAKAITKFEIEDGLEF